VYKEGAANRTDAWRAEKRARLPDGSTRRIIVRGASQEDALRKLAARERSLAKAHPDAERMSLAQYLDKWLDYKAGNVKGATIAEYRRVMAHVKREIGHIPLARVTPLHAQKAITQQVDAGNLTTANNIRRYLKSAFRQAERWELVSVNPLRNIEPVKREAPRRGVWSPAEIQAFLAAAETRPVYRALFMTAIFAGLRRGELMALPWANVTTTGIRVDRTASRFSPTGVNSPKTRESRRTVPIHPSVHEAIASARDGRESEYAFPSRTGSMIEGGNLERAFKATIKAAGVPVIRFHDMRRTAATLWALQGASPKAIQKLLGHSTPYLAMAIYTDVVDGQLQSAVIDPASVLSGGTNGVGRFTETGTESGEGDDAGTAVDGGADAK
jgi:integrase